MDSNGKIEPSRVQAFDEFIARLDRADAKKWHITLYSVALHNIEEYRKEHGIRSESLQSDFEIVSNSRRKRFFCALIELDTS